MSNLNEPTKDFQLQKLVNQSINQWCTFDINDKDMSTSFYKSKKICGYKARITLADLNKVPPFMRQKRQ